METRSDRKFKYSERWGFRWDRKYHLGLSDLSQDRNLPVSVRPKSSTRLFRNDVKRLQKLGSPYFGETELKLGLTDFSRVWLMAEVVHLGGTEFGKSVGPRLLMSVFGGESC